MPMSTFARSLALLLACLPLQACSEPADTAPAVATVTVTPAEAQVAAGTVTAITYRFTPTGAPIPTGDHLVFMHAMTGEQQVWSDDHRPSPPVDEWKAGTTVEYTRAVFIPRAVPRSGVALHVGLYTPATGERLPLGGGEPMGLRAYRAATLQILPPPDSEPLYVEGWHGPESMPSGEQWRWTRANAVLALQNPKRDTMLIVVLDQPAPIGRAQAVTVTMGNTIVDRFEITPGARDVRRIPISVDALGNTPLTRVTISVDQPFVPARIPAMAHPDARDLGVRLYGAYFD